MDSQQTPNTKAFLYGISNRPFGSPGRAPDKPTETPPKKAGSRRGRVYQDWNKTPERRLLKCVLGHLIRRGLARGDLLAEFKRLVPDYQSIFDAPGASDGALWGRADTGRRGGKYAAERPDTHPATRPYWEAAGWIVDDADPLTAADVRSIAELVPGDEPRSLPAAAE